ncbi:hypothetical protein NPIL_55901 [Nephila pilipes]|uniref:Uncharacterized protein n=1 Tax=Nephila pilipes TaxID=299642 RepID=A0A8X6TRI5_NEPPI|nr:hypothetical protein NPIL_55901 [Nephila pilipes]
MFENGRTHIDDSVRKVQDDDAKHNAHIVIQLLYKVKTSKNNMDIKGIPNPPYYPGHIHGYGENVAGVED